MQSRSPQTVDHISLDEAVERVAQTIAAADGDEWLGPLNGRQRNLIAYYIDGADFRKNELASIMPSGISYMSTMGGETWKRYPTDSQLRGEIERALYQRDLYDDQRREAFGWLEDHGFHIEAQSVDCKILDEELSKRRGGPKGVAVPPTGEAEQTESALSGTPNAGNSKRHATMIAFK